MRLHMACTGYGTCGPFATFGHTPAPYAFRGLSASGFALPWRTATAVFVDVQNIYYITRQAYGRQFNYRELRQRISSEGEIVSAIAYATDRGDETQLKCQ